MKFRWVPVVSTIILVLSACSSGKPLNCFDLLDLDTPKNSGQCVAQGYLRKEFSDYFFERSLQGPRDFLILDASFIESGFLTDKVGSRYEFSGQFRHLERRIYRLEVHSTHDLKKIEAR